MIKTPKKRAYYPASKNETDRLMCWLPVDELEAMKAAGKAPEQVLEDYPYGLELEVSNETFREYGIKIGCDAGALAAAYKKLLKAKRLPDSLVIDGSSLEEITRQIDAPRAPTRSMSLTGEKNVFRDLKPGKLPEPEMTGGDDPQTLMMRMKDGVKGE